MYRPKGLYWVVCRASLYCAAYLVVKVGWRGMRL